MKRLVRSRSGRQIYGPKWQNINEGTDDEIESDEGHHSASVESTEIAQVSNTQPVNTIPIPTPGVAAAPPTVIETNVVQPPLVTGQPDGQGIENQTSKGNRTASRSDCQSMYRAALEGDWLAAEVLLERDRTLASVELTERRDRALHVAAAIKHTKFIQELVEHMSPDDLALLDGSGYTACCYAAISGMVITADVMMKKNPNLGTARDKNNITPLHKAALRGRKSMVSYFLRSTKVEDLSKEEWFDLLLVTIRSKMYDVALGILEKDGSLATMSNEEGTALHLLARQDIDKFFIGITEFPLEPATKPASIAEEKHVYLRLLAEKLWAEIQRLEQARVVELIKKPSILHDAAKVGNVELIAMLTRTYPDLIWDTDSNGYTMFHIAVIYRQGVVFGLIHELGAMKDLILASEDKNGNNILHLAGELAPPNTTKDLSISALQMQREIAWFKEVEINVPPSCLEMRNADGKTPRELFSKQHEKLLRESELWMRNTADSCMLIATIMLTVVFAAAFTPPGGNNGETGFPILLKTNWFTCFVIFEALALFCSTLCIIIFWSIMTSSFEEDQFLMSLPFQLKMGLTGLFGSLVFAISAFMSAYFLVFAEERKQLVESVIISLYFVLVLVICSQFIVVWLNTSLPELFRIPYRSSRDTLSLFSRNYTTGKE